MKNLNKDQLKKYAEIASALQDKRDELEASINDFNTKVKDAWNDVERCMNEYNDAVGDANSFREEVVAEMQSFYDEKTEKWQEGDAGVNGFVLDLAVFRMADDDGTSTAIAFATTNFCSAGWR